ncbi:hypothetical protein ACFP2H_28040, partial [Mycolicibacterium llatzerense]
LMIPVVGFFNIPAAHADSLTAKESAYVIAYGASSICPSITEHHTIQGVVSVVKGVMEDDFTASQAVDIVNASVAKYCASNWPLLQQTGEYFRNQAQGQRV